jgi:hypothetical protein
MSGKHISFSHWTSSPIKLEVHFVKESIPLRMKSTLLQVKQEDLKEIEKRRSGLRRATAQDEARIRILQKINL